MEKSKLREENELLRMQLESGQRVTNRTLERMHEENRKLREELDREKSEWLEVMRREQDERRELLIAIQSIQQERDNAITALSKSISPETFEKISRRYKEMEQQVNTLQSERDKSYWFVKRYYMTYLHYHGKREDISHNEQFFIYGDANSIIGEINGKKPNGAPVEVERCFKDKEALQSIKESPREEQTK